MKHIGILSFFFAATAAATAQTATNAPAGGAMSLKDCIQSALAHNFDVQVQRINPQISLYNLDAAYSGYDPSFNVSGTHSYNVSSGTYSSDYRWPPRPCLRRNSFSSGLSGALPWGLNIN